MHRILTLAGMNYLLGTRGVLFWGTVSLVAVVLLGMIDFLTGYELSFSLFYLIPISAATWFVGRRLGLTVSSASATAWLIADIASGHGHSTLLINLWNALIRFGFFVFVTLLLAGLRESYRREQELARMDYTTGIANSRYFYELAQLELERARRFYHPFSVAYIDLDNFKQVNDQFGHAKGDEVLNVVGRVVRDNLRAIDVAARLGGDEFALLLPETNQTGARAAVSKIQNELLEQMHSHNWPVTFSIGVVTFVDPPASVDAMIYAADALMYTVKSNSKNGVRYELRAD
jgi:diguanylate cyclase (GGDEF)-like protein